MTKRTFLNTGSRAATARRDATMILIGYRHDLCAGELCDAIQREQGIVARVHD
jgi:hypothetical protein